MGRLTERDIQGQGIWVKDHHGNFGYFDRYLDDGFPAIEKLAHYEDLEEAGRLIELPCAMGDKVWQIDEEGQIQEWKTFQAETRPLAILEENVTYITDWDFIYCCKLSDFGKTVFLTKEEAEAKLHDLNS